MIRNTLASLLDRLDLDAVDARPTQRPEELTVEQYARLANQLAGLG
jgi:16S rRNA A1518/A1519 N6-dimethyltransferase RsmA/KsgA/DIM1 with predicted DNA glycosylase/AP lyase activity